jgi:hypothetical protein
MTILDELDYDYDCSVLATWIGPLARLYYLRTNSGLDPDEREQRKALFGAASDALLPNRPFAWTARDQASVVELTEIPVTVFPILRVPMHASYVIYLSGFSMVAAKAYVRLALAVCRCPRAGVLPRHATRLRAKKGSIERPAGAAGQPSPTRRDGRARGGPRHAERDSTTDRIAEPRTKLMGTRAIRWALSR